MKITAKILENLFLEYNKEYFDGCLIMPKLSTYIGNTSMGIFSVKTKRSFVQKEISIARNFNLTTEELRDLLLHEMIHEYVYDKYGKMNHGKEFKRKMKEFNQLYGFDIRKNSKHLFKKYRNKKSIFTKLFSLFKTKSTTK